MSAQQKAFRTKIKASSHQLLPLNSLKTQKTIHEVEVVRGSFKTLPDVKSSPQIETQSKWAKLQQISQTYRSPNRNIVVHSITIKNLVKFTSSIQLDGLDAAKNMVKNNDTVVVNMQRSQNIDYLVLGLGDSHGNLGTHFSKLITHRALDQIVQVINNTPIIGLSLSIHYSFQNVYQQVEQNLIEQTDFDVKNNGCSLLSMIIVNNSIYCANLGILRLPIFIRKILIHSMLKKLENLHRKYQFCGKIDQAVYKGRKSGNLKVWAPKQNLPGVKLTRCFGNMIGKTVGISADPEVTEFKVPKSGYLLIGSTGLWEIMDILVIDQILDAHFPPTCQEDIDLAIKEIGDQTKSIGIKTEKVQLISLQF